MALNAGETAPMREASGVSSFVFHRVARSAMRLGPVVNLARSPHPAIPLAVDS